MTSVTELQQTVNFYKDATVAADFVDYSLKVGCLATVGDKIIAVASQRLVHDSLNVPYVEACYHAEYNVLNMLPNPAKVTLYVAKLKNDRELPSRPCVSCMKQMLSMNVPYIVYLDRFLHVVRETL